MTFSRIINYGKRLLNQTAWGNSCQTETEFEKRQRIIEDGYNSFCQLTRTNEIDSVKFDGGKAVVRLKDGRRYHFDANDRVARMYTVPHTGTFEAKETEFVRNFIRPGQVCFDIGANFGWYTILLSRLVGSEGHVHAFEPIPHTFDVLHKNVTLNECENITITKVALDSKKGEKELFLPDIGVSGSFCLHEYEKDYDIFRCPTETLDNYCIEHGINRVDFIKADIEGAEWSMLKGATEIIRESMPVLFLEIQQKSTTLFEYEPVELFDWLMSFGYKPYHVSDESSLVYLKDHQGRLPDYNFFFLPDKERKKYKKSRI